MFAMRSHISVAEEKVGVLQTTVHRMGPDISNLRDAMTALYDSVVKLKMRDVTCIVDDVLRAVESTVWSQWTTGGMFILTFLDYRLLMCCAKYYIYCSSTLIFYFVTRVCIVGGCEYPYVETGLRKHN